MNSCVPNVFGSVTPPQCVLILTGRLDRGPTPSRQLYSSAKQPPGQRTTGTFRSRRACRDRKSTRLNSSHLGISYAVFCLKKKKNTKKKKKTHEQIRPKRNTSLHERL